MSSEWEAPKYSVKCKKACVHEETRLLVHVSAQHVALYTESASRAFEGKEDPDYFQVAAPTLPAADQ